MAQELTKQTKLFQVLADPKVKTCLQMALPKHLTSDRLIRVAMTACQKTPLLMECTQKSVVGAIIECAQLGLMPDGVLGHAYLIPFKNKKKDIYEVQLMTGYRGLIDLARRSGQVEDIFAHEVCENDDFDYQFGTDSKLNHIPADGERGEITHFYMVAKMTSGGNHFEVMTRSDVEKIRDKSVGYRSDKYKTGPWNAYFAEMGKKTVVRRAAKYLPLSAEFQRAAVNDEAAEAGIPQDLASNVIDAGDLPPEAKEQVEMPKEKKPVTDAKQKKLFSTRRRDFMFAAGKNEWDEDKIKWFLNMAFKVDDVNNLNEEEYEQAFEWVNHKKPTDKFES